MIARLTAIALLSVGLIAPTTIAQQNGSPPCSSDEFRQLDFWVGTWDATWTLPDGSEAKGSNTITKDEYGSCVIFERFSAPGLNGMSVSTYHAALGQWRQTWVDDQGGYFTLVGGPSDAYNTEFELELSRLTDQSPYLRMIWQDVTPDSFVWRWQARDASKPNWEDRWVINYTRAVPNPK